MQSAEIIKDLGLNYAEGPSTMPRKYYALNNRIDVLQNELKQKLHNKKDKKKIDKLIDMVMETGIMECDEQFVCGFVLATRIMSEAFTYKM